MTIHVHARTPLRDALKLITPGIRSAPAVYSVIPTWGEMWPEWSPFFTK